MNTRQNAPALRATPSAGDVLGRAHRARLLQIWRSAGWPHRDSLELDLIAAGLVQPVWPDNAHETLRVTPAGFDWLADARQRNRRALSPHDRLAGRVALKLTESGRIVWRELSLRARVESRSAPLETQAAPSDTSAAGGQQEPAATAAVWRMARPDVFSVRNTSVEAYLHPIVHEIKVSRADLLGDLRNPAKRQAYAWLCCECYYVFPAGIATADDIPADFGVWVIHGGVDDGHLELLRPAKHSACQLPFAVWMALAKATPMRLDPEDRSQSELVDAFEEDQSGLASDQTRPMPIITGTPDPTLDRG